MRARLKEVSEYTASLFDEFIIDDFFFTQCMCEDCVREKGDRSWEEFRLAKMMEVSRDLIIGPAKKVNPKRFCDTGLYKYVRCPNYFSEILFWFGVTVSGIGAVQGRQWILVIIAFVLIAYVMYNSAQRLELRHEKTYGLDPEYQEYSDTVPLLFPFTRQYHSMKVYRD